jgi:transcriptional regulator of met regulon
MYNKLFSKIVDSSIWLEPTPTRIVWLMFIAVMNEDGFVQFASVANVAHRARITDEEAEQAIKILEGPDPNSADEENDGRRIEKVPGGWMILNAQKYRDLVTREMVREQTRRRVARKRAKDKGVTLCNADVTQRNGSVTQSDTDTKKERSAKGSRPQSVEDWLKELEADKTYAGIDVRREYGKMLNWCKLRSKKPTQRRFVNWLNNAEKSLPAEHAARQDYKRNYLPPARELSDEEFEAQRKIALAETKRAKEAIRNG